MQPRPNLSVLVFWVIGFITALSGKMTPVPVLGSKYQEWFAGVFT